MVCTVCGYIGADVRPGWSPHVNKPHVRASLALKDALHCGGSIMRVSAWKMGAQRKMAEIWRAVLDESTDVVAEISQTELWKSAMYPTINNWGSV